LDAADQNNPLFLLLLGLDADSLVNNLNGKLLGTSDDLLALAEGDVMVDDSSATTILHQKHFDVLHVANIHAVKTIIAAIADATVSTKANAGHLSSSLEATTHGVIDTMGLSPSVTKTKDVIAVIAVEMASSLLELLHCYKKQKIKSQQKINRYIQSSNS